MLLRILTLPQKATRRKRRQHQASGSLARHCAASHAEEAGFLPVCTSRFLVVFFSVDRGHGGTRAGHEDFGDTLAAHMASGKAQTYLEGRLSLLLRHLLRLQCEWRGRDRRCGVTCSCCCGGGSTLSVVVNVASPSSCATLRSRLPTAHKKSGPRNPHRS